MTEAETGSSENPRVELPIDKYRGLIAKELGDRRREEIGDHRWVAYDQTPPSTPSGQSD